jgi:hypothetical protein
MSTEQRTIKSTAITLAEDGRVVIDDPELYKVLEATQTGEGEVVTDEEGIVWVNVGCNAGCKEAF